MILPYMLYNFSERHGLDLPWPKDLEHNIVADWYYSPWNEEKYKTYLALRSFDQSGLVGNYFDYLQALSDDKHYLKRYGMTYEDIKDPTKLRSTQATQRLVSSSLNFVSSNIRRLYG